MQPVYVAGKPSVVQRYSGRCGGCGNDVHAVSSIIADDGVFNVDLEAIVIGGRNAIPGKPEDHAVFDVHGFGLENVHSLDAITEAVYGNASDGDYVSSGSIDDDPG